MDVAMKLEVFEAYGFICPVCGGESYGKPEAREFSRERSEAIYRALNQLDDWEEVPEQFDLSELITFLPETFICMHCGSVCIPEGRESIETDEGFNRLIEEIKNNEAGEEGDDGDQWWR